MSPGITSLNSSRSTTSPMGYTGLQPPKDSSSGASVVHAVFSIFIKVMTTSDPNCHASADGGPGVSCTVNIQFSYSDPYLLKAKNVSGRTWSGTLVDGANGDETRIGEYILLKGSGGIKGSQVGFVEDYPWNLESHIGGGLPHMDVKLVVSSSETGGVRKGTFGHAYEYGGCVGKGIF